MPNISVRKLLIDLALKEAENVKIAKTLAYYYPNIVLSDKKSLFESLMRYYQISENPTSTNLSEIQAEEINLDTIKEYEGRDYRIKSIEIANVRGIPQRDKDGVAFGIDFTDDSIINNAIILANNGVGKSSIFSALEMIFTQEISERKLRNESPALLTKEEYNQYLRRIPYADSPYCSIQTLAGDFNFVTLPIPNEKQRKILNPSNQFISDFDIYHYGQKDFDGSPENSNSFHSLVAESLGLGDLISLQSILKETGTYRRSTESGNLRKLERQKDDAISNISGYKEQIELKEGELQQLKISEGIMSKNGQKDRNGKPQELLARHYNYNCNAKEYTQLIETFSNAYLKSQSIILDKKGVTVKDFLASGLQLLDDTDNCPFCNSSHKTKAQIKEEVEARILKLQESQHIDELLKQEYRRVTDSFSTYYKQTNTFYEELSKERIEIAAFGELGSLLERENELYVKLSPVTNDSELQDHINLLQQKTYPAQSDYDSLYNLVTQNIIKSNGSLIDAINLFIEERKKILTRVVSEKKDDPGVSTIDQKIIVIETDIKRLQHQIDLANNQIEQLKPQIEKAERDADIVENIKSQLNNFIPLLDAEINVLVNEAFDPIKETVETLLNDYLKPDFVSLEIIKKENKIIVDGEEIINNVIVANLQCVDKTTGKIITVTPDMYFNTFRYKLFCLMVSLSLALATRKKYKINMPLIIDDIFFSSDFVSKNSFADFLQKIISLFYKETPEMPLQFILFTHDDLIFRSAIDAVDTYRHTGEAIFELCEENKRMLSENTMIGRFFSPNDKDDKPSSFSNETKYWNLLYRIPKSVNHLITV